MAAVGDGPVDASLKAVERVVGLPISLKDYQIRAITAGKDALGKQPLRLNTTVACTMVVVSAPISLNQV